MSTMILIGDRKRADWLVQGETVVQRTVEQLEDGLGEAGVQKETIQGSWSTWRPIEGHREDAKMSNYELGVLETNRRTY